MLREIDAANRVLALEGLPVRLELRSEFGSEPPSGLLNLIDVRDPEVVAYPVVGFMGALPSKYFPEQRTGERFLLLSENITPAVAESLRQRNIMYLDARGNCFVNEGPIFVDIRGRTRAPESSGRARGGELSGPVNSAQNLFTPRRAQVIAVLLSFPELLGKPTRLLAKASDTSVGTTSQTLSLLKETGYLFESGSGFSFTPNKVQTLVDTWVDAYSTGLGKRLELFHGKAELSRLGDIDPRGWVSGEAAVPELVRGGDSVTLYVDHRNDLKSLIKDSRMRNDPQGNVLVRRAFWSQPWAPDLQRVIDSESDMHGWSVAPRILLIADLAATRDPRLVEVSQTIRAQLLRDIDAQR